MRNRQGHLGAKRMVVAVYALAAVHLACALYVGAAILEGMPHTQDEVAYLFQAKVFALGHLYLPSLPEPARRFFDHEFIVNNGKWYSKYTPGGSMLHVPLVFLGLHWFTNPLLGTATVIVLCRLAALIAGRRAGLAAAAIHALNPFSVLLSASHFSHTPALLFTLIALLGPLRGARTGRRADWALGGVGLGLLLITRPYNALVLCPVVGGILLAYGLRQRRCTGCWPLAEWGSFGAVALIFLGLTLLYNLALTGKGLLFPQQAYCPYDRPGFGLRAVETPYPRPFGPEEAKKNVLANWRSFRQVGLPWPGLWLLALAPACLLSRQRSRVLLCSLLLPWQAAAYGLYFHAGIWYGPRYWYEAYWAIPVLVGSGAAGLLSCLERLRPSKARRLAVVALAAFWLTMALADDLRYFPIYRGLNRMYRLPPLPLQGPALVFVPAAQAWQDYGRYFWQLNPALARNRVIFAREQALHNVWRGLPPLPDELLLAHFPGRAAYRLVEGPL